MEDIRPQKGFQEKALSTSADIAILGGAAGGGKTWVELYEPTRHALNKNFRCVIFRRSMPQIKGPGGLWDASSRLYPLWGAKPRESLHDWTFPSGAQILMRQIEHEKNLIDWQGTEIDLIEFDELTHFEQGMFIYFLSRGRSSTSGIRPYIRATCNPDPDSWVATFIEWWIDQETGYPIPERAGKLRYMTCVGDTFIWGDTVEEVIENAPSLLDNETVKESGLTFNPRELIKTVTFIPGKLSENIKLLKANPGYLGSLLALPEKEKAMLLEGNWKIRTDGLGVFNPVSVQDMFSNFITDTAKNYITCDAARFGRDLMVIFVWQGWRVVRIVIAHKSDERMIVNAIEKQRREWNVPKSQTLVDQDGVGGGTVALGGYVGFSGGAPPLPAPRPTGPGIYDPKPENYFNLKTQCYYRMGDRVGWKGVQVIVTTESVIVLEESGQAEMKETRGTQVRVGNKVWQIQELISRQLRAIKKAKPDFDGKKKINDKSEQKSILGHSPDFADTLMMREFFELKPADMFVLSV